MPFPFTGPAQMSQFDAYNAHVALPVECLLSHTKPDRQLRFQARENLSPQAAPLHRQNLAHLDDWPQVITLTPSFDPIHPPSNIGLRCIVLSIMSWQGVALK